MTKRLAKKAFPTAGSLLFVYGTLQKGGQYHYFLERCGAQFTSSAKLVTPYPLILAQYPCLLDQPGKGYRVSGEVYTIKHSGDWASIDQLEGYPHEYTRRREAVETDSGILTAWTYFYLHPDQLDPSIHPVHRFQT